MVSLTLKERIRHRLADETGRIEKQAPFTVALCYPSPYAAGMSSLGYQQIYRSLMDAPGMACERAFLDDECEGDAAARPEHPVTYESLRPIEDLPVLAFSVAYELEMAGLIRMLNAAGIPARRADRDERHPLVVAGGPLTFSNPMPLSGIVDAIVVGEADARVVLAMRAVEEGGSRAEQLDRLAAIPHVFVPTHHRELPRVGAEDDAILPAHSTIRTPHTVLANMFLVESERGCSRGCSYCVMRRSTNGGMRIVPAERILETIPADARRVGLVGAAVSDHPKIVSILNALADRGCEVGLSSLRPDRLANTEGFVAGLARVGYRTLTTAMDGTSERVRETLDRRARPKHLLECAALAKKHGMDRMKLYLMVGTPGETDADIDECVAFTAEISRIVPLALGIAPFCAKRNTPLDGAPFAGIRTVERSLDRLRRGLRGRVDVRATSARWAWVEYVLAQGGEAEGLAVIAAVAEGGSFRAYQKAFEGLESPPPARRKLSLLSDSP
ncbi:MAG TPA: radical SAM protein [Polyangiaceae bacterium]|nr:radical SAM protein [Polyangiaceae bacterium]